MTTPILENYNEFTSHFMVLDHKMKIFEFFKDVPELDKLGFHEKQENEVDHIITMWNLAKGQDGNKIDSDLVSACQRNRRITEAPNPPSGPVLPSAVAETPLPPSGSALPSQVAETPLPPSGSALLPRNQEDKKRKDLVFYWL